MTPLNISLAELITRLDDELPDADDLARISEAHLRSQTLTDLGDQLVDHYVSAAKQNGASWTAIGDAIGVSKQGAQQRRASTPFDGFTTLNRHSIVLAQEAARAHKHNVIGTGHLLLGLLGEPRGGAYTVLTAKASSEEAVRDAVEAALPPRGARTLRGHIPFGSDSHEAIHQARLAAESLGHDGIGTEHLLLSLLRSDGTAAQVLCGLGFTVDELQTSVTAAIAGRLEAPAQ